MSTPVTKKLGLKPGLRAIFVDAPTGILELIDVAELHLATSLTGEFDYIHFFTSSAAGLDDAFPRLKGFLKRTGVLWISWPKGGKLGTDLRLPRVIGIGYSHGLVESKCVSVDGTWSALKFTHPKPGKMYQNRYGELRHG